MPTGGLGPLGRFDPVVSELYFMKYQVPRGFSRLGGCGGNAEFAMSAGVPPDVKTPAEEQEKEDVGT